MLEKVMHLIDLINYHLFNPFRNFLFLFEKIQKEKFFRHVFFEILNRKKKFFCFFFIE